MALGKKKMLHQAADAGFVDTENFAPVLYTGNSGTQSISSLDFQPDLVWSHWRSGSTSRNSVLFDSIRGATNYIKSQTASASNSISNSLTSFNEDGFTLGSWVGINESGSNWVAWCWKAGGSSNTYNIDGTGYSTASAAGLDGGTINPTGASVNTEAGFSIVKYTGNGNTTTETVGHGLNSAPELIIQKAITTLTTYGTNDWVVGGTVLGAGAYMKLNTIDIKNTSDYWGETLPTDSVFSISGDAQRIHNENNGVFINYCFHSVDEYQKVGSYSGGQTLNTDNIVDFGFTPRFVIVKNITDTTGWLMIDSIRPNGYALFANNKGVEADYSGHIKLSSSGLRFDGNNNNVNASGNNYIYLAIA